MYCTHAPLILQDFTIDGHDDDDKDNTRDILLYVAGEYRYPGKAP